MRVQGQLAWAAEPLHDESCGTCLGTAVLTREPGAGKILHGSLTFLVPSGVATDEVATVRAFEFAAKDASWN